MSTIYELESTLTDRYQTTVPDGVRKALKLNKRDKVRYAIQPDGKVLLTRGLPDAEEDPTLGKFLKFLARDIEKHPKHLQAIDASFAERIQSLVSDVDVDLDAPLEDDEDE